MPSVSPKKFHMTFFGDSICVGQGVSMYHGWVTRLARDIDDWVEGYGCEGLVTNASVNGRTTRQALEDMPYQVQSHGSDMLLLQFGLNDCNYWESDKGVPRVSRAAFVANLQEIIERGRRSGARAFILNNNHPTSRTEAILPHTSISYEDSNRSYNQAIREVAQTAKDDVFFIDVELIFQNEIKKGGSAANFLLEDGLHLNARGHTLYYEKVSPMIKAVIDGAFS